MGARFDGVIYDFLLWIFTVITDLFFREIHPRSTWRIPRTGPIIFVAAPHANQFVDPLILMRVVRQDAKRRIAFLIAEKSTRRKFVGFASGLMRAVSVGRALDSTVAAKGRIWLDDGDGEGTLIKGEGTDFTDEKLFMSGGLLVLPSVNNVAANTEIKEIVSATEIRLKKPFKGDVALKQLTGQDIGEGNGHLPASHQTEDSGTSFHGTSFKVAPHVDQSAVYNAVFARLREGGCIGIFPEGGSHDRTELLPLKAGLAIMALGALAENPDCGVTIVPVGMNYFHAHKFRSRAVIEFGPPISIDPELVEQYRDGDRRGATGKVLEIVYDRLTAVTTLAPDYDTLMLIQAVRRLYNPKGKRLPLPMVVELNRRLIKGYTHYKDDPRVVHLRQAVLDYNRLLFRLNIRDHQIEYAKFSWYKVVAAIIYRVGKLSVLSIAVLPGTFLFAPVFLAGKIISRIKAREALAASTVKIHARDVIATWKILVSLALTPILDIIYTGILTYWTSKNRVGGRVPEWIPIWLVATGGLLFFPAVCFAALRFGEIGMDIFKSLRPLVLSLNPSSGNSLVKLRKRREWLQDQVNTIINELGPELFPDFDQRRIVGDAPTAPPTQHHGRPRTSTDTSQGDGAEIDALEFTAPTPPPPPSAVSAPVGTRRSRAIAPGSLPRNESFGDISKVGIFASRPTTPTSHRSRSRTHSGSHKLKLGFSPLSFSSSPFPPNPKAPTTEDVVDSRASDMEAVSKNLQAAMRERGRKRRASGGDGEAWELERDESTDGDGGEGIFTPGTTTTEEEEGEGWRKKDL